MTNAKSICKSPFVKVLVPLPFLKLKSICLSLEIIEKFESVRV